MTHRAQQRASSSQIETYGVLPRAVCRTAARGTRTERGCRSLVPESPPALTRDIEGPRQRRGLGGRLNPLPASPGPAGSHLRVPRAGPGLPQRPEPRTCPSRFGPTPPQSDRRARARWQRSGPAARPSPPATPSRRRGRRVTTRHLPAERREAPPNPCATDRPLRAPRADRPNWSGRERAPRAPPATNGAPASPAADYNSRQPLRRGACALLRCGPASRHASPRLLWRGRRPAGRPVGASFCPSGGLCPPVCEMAPRSRALLLPRLQGPMVVCAGRTFSHEAFSPRVLIPIILYFSYGRYGKIKP